MLYKVIKSIKKNYWYKNTHNIKIFVKLYYLPLLKIYKMKKIITLSIATLFSGFLIADPPAGPANAGMCFGEKTNKKKSISADKLVEKLNASDEKMDVKVQGEVAQVCAAEGCWLKMKTATGTIMIKMKDHKFLVPMAMSGKTVVVKGVAEKKVTSVEMLQHYAEDAGKTKEEIAMIKEPKQEVVVQATGIYVVN